MNIMCDSDPNERKSGWKVHTHRNWILSLCCAAGLALQEHRTPRKASVWSIVNAQTIRGAGVIRDREEIRSATTPPSGYELSEINIWMLIPIFGKQVEVSKEMHGIIKYSVEGKLKSRKINTKDIGIRLINKDVQTWETKKRKRWLKALWFTEQNQ